MSTTKSCLGIFHSCVALHVFKKLNENNFKSHTVAKRGVKKEGRSRGDQRETHRDRDGENDTHRNSPFRLPYYRNRY